MFKKLFNKNISKLVYKDEYVEIWHYRYANRKDILDFKNGPFTNNIDIACNKILEDMRPYGFKEYRFNQKWRETVKVVIRKYWYKKVDKS